MLIASHLYGVKYTNKDVDFIVDGEFDPKKLPPDWRQNVNTYGNYKLYKNPLLIDVIPLSNIHSILRRNLSASIENYLSRTPLDVQTLVYDIRRRVLVGEIGINAIKRKTVGMK
jgi:hypothetical protein